MDVLHSESSMSFYTVGHVKTTCSHAKSIRVLLSYNYVYHNSMFLSSYHE